MNAKTFLWIGTIFIIGSGSFYTIERFGQWFSLGTIQGGMASNSGNYVTTEINVTLSDNQFVIPLLLVGIIFILIGIFLTIKERK
jgi:hypothetical protein